MSGALRKLRQFLRLRADGVCGAHGCGESLGARHLPQHERGELFPLDSAVAVLVHLAVESRVVGYHALDTITHDLYATRYYYYYYYSSTSAISLFTSSKLITSLKHAANPPLLFVDRCDDAFLPELSVLPF